MSRFPSKHECFNSELEVHSLVQTVQGKKEEDMTSFGTLAILSKKRQYQQQQYPKPQRKSSITNSKITTAVGGTRKSVLLNRRISSAVRMSRRLERPREEVVGQQRTISVGEYLPPAPPLFAFLESKTYVESNRPCPFEISLRRKRYAATGGRRLQLDRSPSWWLKLSLEKTYLKTPSWYIVADEE